MLKNDNLQGPLDREQDAGRTFIVFRVADNLFGVSIESIREIIEPAHITRVPLASDVIKGIINVRGVIIPMIDLCKRLYNSEMKQSGDSRIFICEIKDRADTALIGGLVDAVVSVIDIDNMELSDSPEFGSKLRPDFIKCVGRMHDRFVMLLDLARVFDVDDLVALHAIRGTYKDKNLDISSREYNEEATKGILNKQGKEESIKKTNYILFKIDDERYGVGMDRVIEIVRVEKMERLPNSMPFMKGIMNIRNAAVPLVDMRLRCGLPEKAYTADTRVLVINTGGCRVGLVVDTVSAVMEIRADAVQDTLHYSAQIDRDFILGIAEVDNRFTVLVNVDRILTDDELQGLKRMEEETAVDPA